MQFNTVQSVKSNRLNAYQKPTEFAGPRAAKSSVAASGRVQIYLREDGLGRKLLAVAPTLAA
jgi:hypothetical protein